MSEFREINPSILTFDQFAHRIDGHPTYNNFFLYFAGHMEGELYRNKAHYQRFAQEHGDLAVELCEKVQSVPDDWDQDWGDFLKPFDEELYEAYLIMRGYGLSDRDLFS